MQDSISFRRTSFYLSDHSTTTFQALLENSQRIDTACCTECLSETAHYQKNWEDVCTLYSQALHSVAQPQQGTSSLLTKFFPILCCDANYVVYRVLEKCRDEECGLCVQRSLISTNLKLSMGVYPLYTESNNYDLITGGHLFPDLCSFGTHRFPPTLCSPQIQ